MAFTLVFHEQIEEKTHISNLLNQNRGCKVILQLIYNNIHLFQYLCFFIISKSEVQYIDFETELIKSRIN